MYRCRPGVGGWLWMWPCQQSSHVRGEGFWASGARQLAHGSVQPEERERESGEYAGLWADRDKTTKRRLENLSRRDRMRCGAVPDGRSKTKKRNSSRVWIAERGVYTEWMYRFGCASTIQKRRRVGASVGVCLGMDRSNAFNYEECCFTIAKVLSYKWGRWCEIGERLATKR